MTFRSYFSPFCFYVHICLICVADSKTTEKLNESMLHGLRQRFESGGGE